MKRRAICLLLMAAVLIPTWSAMGAVYINCTDLGNGVIQLSYDFSEEEVRVRAFSLDVRVSDGIIVAATEFNPYYNIYPGSIIIDEYGEVTDYGSPICPPTHPGTLPGLGTYGVTIEMGSLYNGEANAPPPTGVLLAFAVTEQCNITMQENAMRGGVVMEDPEFHPPVYLCSLQGVLPAEPNGYGGGCGTPADPYLIFDANQLNAIGATAGHWHKHFRLMADIDLGVLSAADFNIIGPDRSTGFRGTFDGNKHNISNFRYSSDYPDGAALFGRVDYASTEIKDLDLINPNVNVAAGDNVGALAGFLRSGTIARCSAKGGIVIGRRCVGGLVGRNYLGAIENCYAATDVVGDANVGGLVGRTYADISNCYSTGSVWEYADLVGGFAGFNKGNILTSFWDVWTSGQTDATGGTGGSAVTDVTGKSTAEMKVESTFTTAGWDFEGESSNGTEDIWTICEGESYPKLVRKRLAGDFVGRDGVNAADFAFFADCWMKDTCECLPADITGNGLVDAHDLQDLAQNWLAGL